LEVARLDATGATILRTAERGCHRRAWGASVVARNFQGTGPALDARYAPKVVPELVLLTSHRELCTEAGRPTALDEHPMVKR
jgi:hypothetical protein